ncbi:hypothetical protein OO255_29650, partial [Pseudomonas sp. DCB_BZ]
MNRSRTAQLEVLEGRTSGVHRRVDTQADLASVVVNVIALCSVGVRRAGFAGLDGDLSIVAQGHDQVVSQRLVDVHG